MQSEHLTNLHPGWVAGGWAIAVAVTSMIYLGGVGAGLTMAGSGEVVWVVASMAGGFFVGGLFVGMRWSDAPVLHGVAITGFSVLAIATSGSGLVLWGWRVLPRRRSVRPGEPTGL